jgi:hypothetical protein
MEVFVMKKFLNKPFTWGDYLKLVAVCYAAFAGWYVWWLEIADIFSVTGWVKNKFNQIKQWFIR